MFSQPESQPPEPPRLILASASPRRALLLREHGYRFDIVEPPGEEPQTLAGADSPTEHAEALSCYKARSAAAGVKRGVVLGADTVAALGDTIFGKPADRNDARRILRRLAGTTHEVITGVTLLDIPAGTQTVVHDRTAVTMRPLAPEDIEAYLDTGAWEGKAGAYGIQDHGDAFVAELEGSFTNVVGLPMELVSDLLHERGIHPRQVRDSS